MSLLSDDQQSNNELARTLGRIEETLKNFEASFTKLDHQLFGNGQPGKLSVLDTRLSVLEDYKSTIKGAFATLGGLVTLIGGTTLYHLFFGRK